MIDDVCNGQEEWMWEGGGVTLVVVWRGWTVEGGTETVGADDAR